ncbi:hypothetical protein [Paenibacillus abyssi]|uniref:Uncharacterized protein n=1 Tax=Paenibacillus abyssi TaxID=1340531 RepID=A0A917FTK8_9BACL|nr:hypothetical protein [Paenibacillus abyssi]GGG03828.1 hypothetical protein GCM10010916_21150 [Paenibacillus abyssi]
MLKNAMSVNAQEMKRYDGSSEGGEAQASALADRGSDAVCPSFSETVFYPMSPVFLEMYYTHVVN